MLISTGDANQILKLDLSFLINKQIFQMSSPEIFQFQVPNIASVHARLITTDYRKPNTHLEEVTSTFFTVTLIGKVHSEVEREDYRVSLVTKTELKNIDGDTNLKSHDEVKANQDGDFSHGVWLLSSEEVADMNDIVKLKYTISLVKSVQK